MQELVDLMQKLRQECPWDAKQTHQSLKPYLIEEAYEVLESIDHESWDDLASELGDLLLQIVFHSQIAVEQDHFSFDTVVKRISNKLIERHPHVFNKGTAKTADEVQSNWEHHKVKSENRSSLLGGIPASAPALLRAQRLQDKASTVGFDWNSIYPVMDKLEEEWKELRQAVDKGKMNEIRAEFGDILFTMVNLSRYLDLDSEDALRETNEKFIKRFQYIEKHYDNNLDRMKKASLEEMDQLWEESKDQA